MIHMRIMQEGELVVDLPNWNRPIPRVGDYIFHPPLEEVPDHHGPNVGCVKTVTWRTHDRYNGKFVQALEPYVEVYI